MKYVHFKDNPIKKILIGNIICLAQTYQKHADEMHSQLPPHPIIFLKPTSSVIYSQDSICIPSKSSCLHHEIELGVVMRKNACNITPEHALDYVYGYLVGLDITARDIQSKAKKKGHPWTIAKGFDTFAPLSTVVTSEKVKDPNELKLELTVNGSIRQKESTQKLHWSVEEIISYISEIMTLDKGDIILTGTPDGVAEIKEGDILTAKLFEGDLNLCSLSVDVKNRYKISPPTNRDK